MGKTFHFVTGANSEHFAMALMLLQSFTEQMPSSRLSICDFGLNERQRSFLAALDVLVNAPPDLGAKVLPWVCKASLGAYLPDQGWDAAVWIDADIILLKPLGDSLGHLLELMTLGGYEVAAAGHLPELSLSQMATSLHAPGFVRALVASRVDIHRPYLNSGFFVSRSKAFFDEWRSEASQPPEVLFEQNCFNVVCHRRSPGPLVLDPRLWNLNNYALTNSRLGEDGKVHADTGVVATLLHATGQDQLKAISIDNLCRPNGVRICLNEPLGRLQLAVMTRFLSAQARLLSAHGLMAEA